MIQGIVFFKSLGLAFKVSGSMGSSPPQIMQHSPIVDRRTRKRMRIGNKQKRTKIQEYHGCISDIQLSTTIWLCKPLTKPVQGLALGIVRLGLLCHGSS